MWIFLLATERCAVNIRADSNKINVVSTHAEMIMELMMKVLHISVLEAISLN